MINSKMIVVILPWLMLGLAGCGAGGSQGSSSYVASCDINSDIRYTRDDVKEIVTDTKTCLQWQDQEAIDTLLKPWVTKENAQKGDFSNTSGDTATTYCKNLSLDGGRWRLPTKAELLSATDSKLGDPWVHFGYRKNNSFWSSTVVSGHGNQYAWWAFMGAEDVRGDNTTNSNLKKNLDTVRCVRETNASEYESK